MLIFSYQMLSKTNEVAKKKVGNTDNEMINYTKRNED